ncbi:MAG: hypothetical protein SFU98_07105 [Leptospiraceae bacterium]|nr:hypothetical protein [Leptospiraceae bacterium]
MGIELLIPFLASIAVFFLFRKLDTSSFKLSQIKKFSHKLTDELEGVARDGVQSVKDATIDLDLMNKQAKRLIIDLETKANETASLLSDLHDNKVYLDTVLVELKDVVKLTTEIREEAKSVQEGMNIIHTQRQELAKVSSSVDSLQIETKELIGKFQEKLDDRTGNILESLATKIVELETLLEVKSDKVDESLRILSENYKLKLTDEVEALALETVNKVEHANVKLDDFNNFVRDSERSLENRLTLYRDSTESIAERIERLDTRLEEKAETVGESVQTRLMSFEKKFQERFEAIFEQLSQNKESFLSGVKMEIDLVRTEIEGMSLETMTRKDEILTEARRQAETVLSNINNFFDKYMDAENRLLKTAELKKSELLKEIHRFENDFKQSSENFYSDAELLKDSIYKNLHNFESEMNKATASIESNTREKFILLREELEESMLSLHGRKKAEFLDELGAIDLKIKELGRDTSNKIKSVDDHFYDLKNALIESSKEILHQVEKEVDRIHDDLVNRRSNVDQKLEFFAEGWNLELEKIKSRTNKEVDTLVERLKDIHVEGREISDSIRLEFVNGKSSLETIVARAKEELDSQINGLSGEVQTKVKRSQEEVEVLLNRLQKTGSHLYEKQENLLTEYGDRLHRDLQNKLEKTRIECDEVLEQIQRAGMNLLEKQEEKIDKLNSTIDERISRQLTVLLDKGQLQLDQLETRITTYVQEVRTNIESSLKNSKEDSERQITGFNAHMKKTFLEFAKANKDFIEDNKTEFQKAKDEFSKFRRDVEKETSEIYKLKGVLLEDFHSEESKVRTSIDKLSNRLSEIESYADLFKNTERVIRESELTVKSMNAMLDRMRIEGESVTQYMKNLDFLKNSKKEIETEMRMLETQKLRIDQIENELSRATSACDQIHARTEELHEKISMVTSIDHKIVEVSRIQEEIAMKVSEFKNLNSKIAEISSAVQATNRMGSDLAEKLQKLYHELGKLENKESELTDQINFVEERAAEIAAKTFDFKTIETKFDKVENLMMDLSTKHKQITTMQKRMETLKTETEEMREGMEELLSQADSKMEKLSGIIHSDFTEVNPNLGKSSVNTRAKQAPKDLNTDSLKRKRATVLSLYKTYDWSPETIAEKLNMDKTVVEAIVRSEKS